MQTLSAYLLDRPNLTLNQAATRATEVVAVVDAWLQEKRACGTGDDTGKFRSLTVGGEGSFRRRRYRGEKGVVEELRLEEPSGDGQRFTTAVYIAALSNRVAVYLTLDVVNIESVVAPAYTDPRCPAIVRSLLERFPDWELTGDSLGSPAPTTVFGRDAAVDLVANLTDPARKLPLVVVSQVDGAPVFPNLADRLAYDLAGLAHVVEIDEAAAWHLTDEMGKYSSCYQGAIRLYWPLRKSGDDDTDVPSKIWTASRILSGDRDGNGDKRIRFQLRKTVMTVAAISLEAPQAIVEIQRQESRKKLAEMEAKATANSQELELARAYEEDNARLSKELSEAKQSIAGLLSRAETAEYALEQKKAEEPLEESEDPHEDRLPTPGEVRYYKKTHSKPTHDVLVRVADCGHSAWQNAAKADKAKKGVLKLEGSTHWKTIQHCGSCSGGGMWKVRW